MNAQLKNRDSSNLLQNQKKGDGRKLDVSDSFQYMDLFNSFRNFSISTMVFFRHIKMGINFGD